MIDESLVATASVRLVGEKAGNPIEKERKTKKNMKQKILEMPFALIN